MEASQLIRSVGKKKCLRLTGQKGGEWNCAPLVKPIDSDGRVVHICGGSGSVEPRQQVDVDAAERPLPEDSREIGRDIVQPRPSFESEGNDVLH